MKLGDLRKHLRALGLDKSAEPEPPRSLARDDNGEAPTRCPKCHAVSPCVHFDSVDVGIGVMTGNHQYACPVHGDFMFNRDDGKPVFAEDELEGPTVHATLTTSEDGRSAKDIIDDIQRSFRSLGTIELPPEVASFEVFTPPRHFDSRCIIDPTTGTRLLPGKTTIAELRALVPLEDERGRFPDITLLPDESLGVGEVFIVSPGGPVARIDISPLPTPSPDDVTFAPVCGICGDVNCETPNAKH